MKFKSEINMLLEQKQNKKQNKTKQKFIEKRKDHEINARQQQQQRRKRPKRSFNFPITMFKYKHDAYTRRNARKQRALSTYTGMNAFQTILCFPK